MEPKVAYGIKSLIMLVALAEQKVIFLSLFHACLLGREECVIVLAIDRVLERCNIVIGRAASQ